MRFRGPQALRDTYENIGVGSVIPLFKFPLSMEDSDYVGSINPGLVSRVTDHGSTRPFSSISSSLSHRSGMLAEPSRRISSSAPRASSSRKSTPIRSSNSISARSEEHTSEL